MLSKVFFFSVGIISVVQTNGENLRTSTGSKYHRHHGPARGGGGGGGGGSGGKLTCVDNYICGQWNSSEWTLLTNSHC